jgi:transcriptional regulator with XRE-family HTH domain
MLPLKKAILQTVKKQRKEKKILSKTMAHQLGMRAENYSRLEGGKANLDFETINEIAKILEVDFDILILESYQKMDKQVYFHKFQEKARSPSSLFEYDARKDFKKISTVKSFQTPAYFRSGKVYAERDIIEKLQQSITNLEKVVQNQEAMLQGQQQIILSNQQLILSQEEEKKQLWKLIDQIEGLQHFIIEKNV